MGKCIDQTVEIKARCTDHETLRRKLKEWGAEFLRRDTQVDIFYNVPRGRLKLRHSEFENLLIGYQRPDISGPKHCRLNLYSCSDTEALDRVLTDCLGRKLIIKKEREHYILGNVKFHLDCVERLGTFMEIEVLGKRGVDKVEDLRAVCEDFMNRCGVKTEDLVEQAYADLLEELPSEEDGRTGD